MYAKFEAIDTHVEETPVSYALQDQSPDLAYEIVAADDMTAEEVLANITLLPTDGSSPVDIKAEKIESRLFRISAVNGFTPGCSYELTLQDGLYFKDKAPSLRKSTFIIHKDEIDNLKYKDDIKYIKDTDEMFYTIEGVGVLPMLNIALFSNSEQEAVNGHFEYRYSDLNFENPFVFSTMPANDITLYAKWEGDEHTVTFDANGGVLPSGSESQIAVKNGEVFENLPKPTFAQHKFLGWFTSRTGGTQVNAGDTVHFLSGALSSR